MFGKDRKKTWLLYLTKSIFWRKLRFLFCHESWGYLLHQNFCIFYTKIFCIFTPKILLFYTNFFHTDIFAFYTNFFAQKFLFLQQILKQFFGKLWSKFIFLPKFQAKLWKLRRKKGKILTGNQKRVFSQC